MKKKLFVAAALAAVNAAAVSAVVYYEIMGRNAKLYDKVAVAVSEEPDAEEKKKMHNDERLVWFNAQQMKKFEMKNDRGQTLRGFLIEPETPSQVYVLCSHGYRSSGRGEFRFTAKYYHDKGFNVFMVDHQAAGESEGSLISFGYYESVDILKWIDFLKKNFGENIEIILHGVSMGCATVTLASGRDDLPENVKFTVADCGYTSVEEQFDAVLKSVKLPSFPIIPMTNLWNKLFGKFSYSDVSPLEAVKNAKVPMLFIHGGNDDFVPTRMVFELYAACPSEKDILIVDGAVHAQSYYLDPIACNKKIDKFIDKYITYAALS